jgi:hypothetical protein
VAELVVAFTLAALLAALGGAALVAAERHVRGAVTGSGDRRTLREVQAVLAGELRAAAADELTLRGDTAADFLGVVGWSVVCLSSGSLLVLPGSTIGSGVPFTDWHAPVAAGDLVAVFDTAPPAGWRSARIDSAASRTDGAGCASSTGFRGGADSAAHRAVTRLRLDRALDAGTGAPVRVLHGGRYVLRLGSDKSWSLNYRDCDPPGVCGTAQPVAGPLAPAADAGLRLSLSGTSPLLTFYVRAPVAPVASGMSQQTRVALRNHAP